MYASSLPHRQLRNLRQTDQVYLMRSLPYRQLRKHTINAEGRTCSSLPYRQLRNLTPQVTKKTHSSLPYRQLRKYIRHHPHEEIRSLPWSTLLDHVILPLPKIVANDIWITDIVRYKYSERTDEFICNWLRNCNTIEFRGDWKQINKPNFKPVEFDGFKKWGKPY